MQYIHIRNLEKFHPGYKDRTLQWGKIYINMAEGDADAELISNEIDWARFIKMILIELRAQKPLPNSDHFWARKGFDLKKRSMSLTLQMLHNFIDIVTLPENERHVDKDKDKDKDKEEDKPLRTCVQQTDSEFLESLKVNPAYKHIDFEVEMGKIDAWLLNHPNRKKTRSFVLRWLNKVEKPMGVVEPKFKPTDPNCTLCKGTGFIYVESLSATKPCECRRKI